MESLNTYYSKEKSFNRVTQNLIEFVDINYESDILDCFDEEEMEKIMPVVEHYFKKGLLAGFEFCSFLKK
ncbi:MAG: hypothetical protein ACLR60_18900 [Clostridium paraputrificum]